MGLSPAEFWGLGLIEWRFLAAPDEAGGALDRAGLDALIALYPDQSR